MLHKDLSLYGVNRRSAEFQGSGQIFEWCPSHVGAKTENLYQSYVSAFQYLHCDVKKNMLHYSFCTVHFKSNMTEGSVENQVPTFNKTVNLDPTWDWHSQVFMVYHNKSVLWTKVYNPKYFISILARLCILTGFISCLSTGHSKTLTASSC